MGPNTTGENECPRRDRAVLAIELMAVRTIGQGTFGIVALRSGLLEVPTAERSRQKCRPRTSSGGGGRGRWRAASAGHGDPNTGSGSPSSGCARHRNQRGVRQCQKLGLAQVRHCFDLVSARRSHDRGVTFRAKPTDSQNGPVLAASNSS